MICGLTGWCIEIMFTSLEGLKKKDYTLSGKTSIWMFPIYGMAVLIRPVYRLIEKLPTLLRGAIYSAGILSCEYLSGAFLKKHHLCPWDYSKAKANIKGIVRLDYAPLWMMVGLLYERILCPQKKKLKTEKGHPAG